eukprot:2733193-Rhodomonas_salina.4
MRSDGRQYNHLSAASLVHRKPDWPWVVSMMQYPKLHSFSTQISSNQQEVAENIVGTYLSHSSSVPHTIYKTHRHPANTYSSCGGMMILWPECKGFRAQGGMMIVVSD